MNKAPAKTRAKPKSSAVAKKRAHPPEAPRRAPAKAQASKAGAKSKTPLPLLQKLGAHIRARRHELSLTLRELGELSGVSERFLVLVEGGHANISVARLCEIAQALNTEATALLSGEPSHGSWPEGARGSLVALLGLRGAGKTTIGMQAAMRMGQPFIELDTLICERAGMSLSEIFELQGTEYYRRLEREELDRLIQSGMPGIVATGGGVVTDHQAFARLRSASLTIWLRATPEDHWNRVIAQGDVRPMQNRLDAMNELRALLRARRALYELAHHVIDTSRLGLSRSIDRVVKLARGAGALTSAEKGMREGL